MLVGVGEAGFSAGGTAMVSGAYPKEKRGRVLGIFSMGIPLGIALGMLYGILNVMAVPSFGAISQDVVPAVHKGSSFGLSLSC
jgi:MFS family permease